MSYTTEKYMKSLISDKTIEDLICLNNVEEFFTKFNTIIVSSYFNSSKQYYDLYSHIYETYNRDTLPLTLEGFTIIFNHYQDILEQKKNMNVNYDGAIISSES